MRSAYGFAFVAALILPGANAATADDYAFAWPLQTTGDTAAWQVELTPEVYAAVSTDDLRDIEVVNASGESVPVAPYRSTTRVAPPGALVELPVFVLPAVRTVNGKGEEPISLHIERGADGKLRRLDAQVGNATATALTAQADLLLDASAVHEAVDVVRIDWGAPEADATAQFVVSASDDLQQWRVLVPGATVMHLKQEGNQLDRHEIALHGVSAAYLRLHRSDTGSALPELKISVRTIASAAPARAGRVWVDANVDGSDTLHLDRSFPAGDGRRPVAYRYSLPAPLAADGFRLELADDNSLASGHLLSRRGDTADEHAWLQRGTFVAFRLRQSNALVDNDEFTVTPAGRARDWRVELATPLERAPTLRIAFVPERFVFLTQGSGPYRLVAGSGRAQRASYPVDAALSQLHARLGADWQPPLAPLGVRTTLRGESALELAPAAPPRDWKTWLLWAVLVAAAALIGGLALSLVRGEKKS